MRRIVLLAATLFLGVACQQAPVSHPPVSTLSPAERLKAEGDAFMAKGDYVNAVEKYRQAADLDPAAVAPRFGLGTAYSFLEKRPEAVLQFRWVLSHADAASREYQEARRWLTRVGALRSRRWPTPARRMRPVRSIPRRSVAWSGKPSGPGSPRSAA